MRSLTVLIFTVCCTLTASHAQDADWTVPDLGMKFVWIKPGTFTMGSPVGEDRRDADETQHQVTLSKHFWCGMYEVTQGEWEALMGTTVRQQRELTNRHDAPLYGEGARHPMYYVSWDDAVAYCTKLTERERAAERLPEGYVYRLLTESEWEYACRAETTTSYNFGADPAAFYEYGNYCDVTNTDKVDWQDKDHYDRHDKDAPVGSYKPNAWGLYDMHGNVYEWCLDWVGDYPTGRVTDPAGPKTGQFRVYRGGSWFHMPRYARSANRMSSTSDSQDYLRGFRVALAPSL